MWIQVWQREKIEFITFWSCDRKIITVASDYYRLYAAADQFAFCSVITHVFYRPSCISFVFLHICRHLKIIDLSPMQLTYRLYWRRVAREKWTPCIQSVGLSTRVFIGQIHKIKMTLELRVYAPTRSRVITFTYCFPACVIIFVVLVLVEK